MRGCKHIALLGGLTLFLIAFGARPYARQASRVQTPVPDNVVHRPNEFAGMWTYNSLDSVNAATGKPEQAPRSATAPRAPGQGGGAGRAGGGGAGGQGVGPRPGGSGGGGAAGAGGGGAGTDNYSSYDGSSGQSDVSSVGPTFMMVQEVRDLARDLLEVPQSLTIKVAPNAVTFVDDLDREQTYATNGSKQKHHLAASEFDAEVQWDASQLKERIQGALGFRLTETYFLSPDGQRLFVVIRVGQPKKNGPIQGFNRVYDRLNR